MSLASWNDTQTKQAILDFVASAADENSPGYIPTAERIAAFDNDGTLWVEQPAPAQTGLLLGKLVEQVKANPALAGEEPFKAIVTGDEAFMTALAQQVPEAVIAFLKGIGQAWEGTTPEEYEAEVRAFLAASKHPHFERPWTDLVYQPILELFDLLHREIPDLFIDCTFDDGVFACFHPIVDMFRIQFRDSATNHLLWRVTSFSGFAGSRIVQRGEGFFLRRSLPGRHSPFRHRREGLRVPFFCR